MIEEGVSIARIRPQVPDPTVWLQTDLTHPVSETCRSCIYELLQYFGRRLKTIVGSNSPFSSWLLMRWSAVVTLGAPVNSAPASAAAVDSNLATYVHSSPTRCCETRLSSRGDHSCHGGDPVGAALSGAAPPRRRRSRAW